MDRKKLVKRLILGAVIVFLASGAVNIFEIFYHDSIRASRDKEKSERIAKLTESYQKYLDETAAKITGVSIDPGLLSRIKSDVFGKMPNAKLYLWMSDTEGNFLFGVPAPVFSRLNKGFDKFRGVIESDGYYLDRNDFLVKLVDRHKEVKFYKSDVTPPARPKKLKFSRLGGEIPRPGEKNTWRFYEKYYSYGETTLSLSAPVLDENNRVIGDLLLKVDDSTLYNKYLGESSAVNRTFFDAFHVIFGASALFLWFLLPTWVYIDAREREVKNIYLWIILTLVSFGFGALIYLITRPQALKSFHCPDCHGELNGTKAFCPFCGFDLSGTFCPDCQYPIKPEWQFCPNCRFDIKQAPKGTIPTGKEEEQ